MDLDHYEHMLIIYIIDFPVNYFYHEKVQALIIAEGQNRG